MIFTDILAIAFAHYNILNSYFLVKVNVIKILAITLNVNKALISLDFLFLWGHMDLKVYQVQLQKSQSPQTLCLQILRV